MPRKIDDNETKISFAQLTKVGADAVRPLLMSQKRYVNFQDANGNTLLHWAVKREKVDLIKLLLAYGADPAIKNKRGNTPLDRAYKVNNDYIIILLQNRDGDASPEDIRDLTDDELKDRLFINRMLRFLETRFPDYYEEKTKEDVINQETIQQNWKMIIGEAMKHFQQAMSGVGV